DRRGRAPGWRERDHAPGLRVRTDRHDVGRRDHRPPRREGADGARRALPRVGRAQGLRERRGEPRSAQRSHSECGARAMSAQTVSALAFVAVLGVFLAGFLMWNARRLRERDTLRRRLGERRADRDDLVREHDDAGITRWLAESGLGWTSGELAARVAVAALLGIVLGAAIGSGALAFILALLACTGLWIVVRRARARRLAQCDEQMPQALEIMALALRAGHALPGALALAAQE